ncbi:MAG: S-layer homology domain-containing protein [Oscillospiraceae bacterium]|nr:S-layer homology domain-containing protein [Oscillospiraceae bacterium]
MQRKIRSIISVILAIILSFSSVGFVSAQPSVDDISGTFFETEFRQAVSRGWINGFPDGTFRPNANITRAEIITLLDNALELPVAESGELAFTDVSEGAWFYETLLKFRAHVNIFSNNEFRGNTFATREEVCYIIFNIIDTDTAGLMPFTDAQDISFWAFRAVAVNNALGIVHGYHNGAFAPRQNITRAEAVVIVYRLSQVLQAGEAILDPIGEINEPRHRHFILEDALLALENIEQFRWMDIQNTAEEFVLTRIRRRTPRNRPVTYQFYLQRVHMGIPIRYATVRITVNANRAVQHSAVSYVPDVSYAITMVEPTISPEDAMKKATEFFDARDWSSPGFVRNPHAIEPSLAIIAHGKFEPQLTWGVPIGGDMVTSGRDIVQVVQRRYYVFYICAHNGELVHVYRYYTFPI